MEGDVFSLVFPSYNCPGTGPDFGELFAPAPSSWGPQFETLAVLGSKN